MDYGKLMEVQRRLAVEAGERIMEIYRSSAIAVEYKSDLSPLTLADRTADALISAGLREAFPRLSLVTEEQPTSHSIAETTFLIVDPLDGTKEFVNRGDDFTVNIALVENGIPTRGIVYAPARNRMFRTEADGGSVEETGPFHPDLPGNMRPIKVAVPDSRALTAVGSKSHSNEATRAYIDRYRVAGVRNIGSSLKFCLVAAGEADFYPRLGPTMEWDTAAGHAVLRGAGGKVVTLDDHRPLRYGKTGYRNPGFVAFAEGVELMGVP